MGGFISSLGWDFLRLSLEPDPDSGTTLWTKQSNSSLAKAAADRQPGNHPIRSRIPSTFTPTVSSASKFIRIGRIADNLILDAFKCDRSLRTDSALYKRQTARSTSLAICPIR